MADKDMEFVDGMIDSKFMDRAFWSSVLFATATGPSAGTGRAAKANGAINARIIASKNQRQ